MGKFLIAILALAVGSVIFVVGCGDKSPAPSTEGKVSGTIKVDGSSTVAPITQAVAEDFQKANPEVKLQISISGTGGGMKKFVIGDLDIADASRVIETREIDEAKKNGIEFIELPVAYDGLAMVVNPKNTWVDHLTVDELKKIWAAGSTVKFWSDVRSGWPHEEIKLYGPGTNSGTYDYFTEAICGGKGKSRPDYTASEDDNVLVNGVSGDTNALGYFGLAYFQENKDTLKLIPVDGGKGPITPTDETVANGTYAPLSRPLFIYVSKKAAARPEVIAFVEFYLSNPMLAKDVGYIELPVKAYDIAKENFKAGKTGSRFQGEYLGKSVEELLSAEAR